MIRKPHPTSFASRLRAAIRARNLTAAAIAKRCGFSRQNMQRFLDGEIGRSKHFPTMANALGIDIDWLMTGDPAHAPSWAPPMMPRDKSRHRSHGCSPAATAHERPDHWQVADCDRSIAVGPIHGPFRVMLDPDRTPVEGDMVFLSGRAGHRIRRLGPTIDDHVVLAAVDGSGAVEICSNPLDPVRVIVGILWSDEDMH